MLNGCRRFLNSRGNGPNFNLRRCIFDRLICEGNQYILSVFPVSCKLICGANGTRELCIILRSWWFTIFGLEVLGPHPLMTLIQPISRKSFNVILTILSEQVKDLVLE